MTSPNMHANDPYAAKTRMIQKRAGTKLQGERPGMVNTNVQALSETHINL